MTATFRLQAASLHQANVDWMSSCLYSTRWIVIGRASRPVVGCSYVGALPGVFPYGRHPRFRDFDPVVPVDVVRVEADLDRFLDSACSRNVAVTTTTPSVRQTDKCILYPFHGYEYLSPQESNTCNKICSD